MQMMGAIVPVGRGRVGVPLTMGPNVAPVGEGEGDVDEDEHSVVAQGRGGDDCCSSHASRGVKRTCMGGGHTCRMTRESHNQQKTKLEREMGYSLQF